MRTALVVASDEQSSGRLREPLEQAGLRTRTLEHATSLRELRIRRSDLIVLEDDPRSGFDALALTREIRTRHAHTPVIVVGEDTSAQRVGALMRAGASAFVARSEPVSSALHAAAAGVPAEHRGARSRAPRRRAGSTER
jgi:DNA-binding NtrC family response regulator